MHTFVLLYYYLWSIRCSQSLSTPAFVQSWAMFIALDYKPGLFWFIHSNMATVAILSLLLVFIPADAPLGLDILAFFITITLVIVNAVIYVK